MTPRVAVFTARIGEATDPLREPVPAEGVEYFCATTGAIHPASVWRPVQVSLHEGDPIQTARRFKLLLHETVAEVAPWADVYVWVDAAYVLHADPRVFLPAVLRGDLAVLRHPHRQSIAAEAVEIAHRHRLPVEKAVLDQQVAAYRADGYPDSQLSSTGLLVRRVDARTHRFNVRWWAELQRHGHPRDQMSFDYAAWATGLRVTFLDGHYRANPYATWHHHR